MHRSHCGQGRFKHGFLIACGMMLFAAPAVAIDPSPGGIQQVANTVPSSSRTADLQTALEHWTATAAQIRTLEGKFTRFEFDAPHQTETRGQGVIRYDALSGRAMYAVEPVAKQ